MAENPGKRAGQVDAQNVPRFLGLRTFARLPRLEDVDSADVAILGAPVDLGTTFRGGPRFGPAGIREASLLLKPYNEALDVFPFDALQVVDAGDAPASPIDIIEAHATIEEHARALHERGTTVIGLGGDHSVALPFLRAAAATHGQLSLLQVDAHTDTWDSYFGGHKVTNGTIFRRATEEGLIDPHRSVQIGLRGGLYSAQDYQENADLGFKMLLARDLDAKGISGALELAHEHCTLPTYVTLDIDALDPAFAPGTGHAGGGRADDARDARAAARADRAEVRDRGGRRGRGLAAVRPERDHGAGRRQPGLGAAVPARALPREGGVTRWSAHLHMLFKEQPFLERFQAAADRGFSVVECWSPFEVELDEFEAAVSAAGVQLAGFNLYSGDMPGGDRGFLNRPAERHDVLANAEDAIALAGRTRHAQHQRARRQPERR